MNLFDANGSRPRIHLNPRRQWAKAVVDPISRLALNPFDENIAVQRILQINSGSIKAGVEVSAEASLTLPRLRGFIRHVE